MKEEKTGAAVPDQSPRSVSESDTGSARKHRTRKKAQDTQEDVIIVNANVDPELNPNSPQFNPERYREELSRLDLSAIEARLTQAVKSIAAASEAATNELIASGAIHKALPDMVIKNLEEILQITKWADATAQAAQKVLLTQIKSTLFDKETAAKLTSFLEALKGTEARIAAIESALEKELPAIREQPGLEDITLDDLKSFLTMDGDAVIPEDIDGTPVPEPIRAALERAIEAARRAELPKAIAKRADIVEYPLDKVNFEIWNLIKEPTGRQLKMNLDMSRDGSKERIPAYYSIDFGELEKQGVKVSKKLLPFDKRVYIAISALYNAGNNVITLTQIHYAMGNTGRPAVSHLQKIQDSITKMTTARIFFDNIKESEAYNYNRFKYDGALLPLERATAIVNGKLADSAIHIFREPPIMTFAKQRKQVTTITVRVLQSPISKTDANLMIDDYLIERISQARIGRQPKKIKYDTLYEHAQITTPSQRTRAPEKIKKYLEHYKACGLISAYKMKEDGITVEFGPPQ